MNTQAVIEDIIEGKIKTEDEVLKEKQAEETKKQQDERGYSIWLNQPQGVELVRKLRLIIKVHHDWLMSASVDSTLTDAQIRASLVGYACRVQTLEKVLERG